MINKNSNLGCSSIKKSKSDFSLENYDQDIMLEEESGWTAYFDDYFSKKTPCPASKHIDDTYDEEEEGNDGCHGGSGSMLCSLQSPSMVSDAASCAAWKSQYKNNDGRSRRAETPAACSQFDAAHMVIHKKLRFKTIDRHKRFGGYYDDSLEDTASSPVNSPKAKREYGHDHQQAQVKLKQQVDDEKAMEMLKGAYKKRDYAWFLIQC